MERLTRASQCQRVRAHIVGNHASGRDNGAVANGDGCDQCRVRADKDFAADFGVVFFIAVIIAGNGACADISIFANMRIANV